MMIFVPSNIHAKNEGATIDGQTDGDGGILPSAFILPHFCFRPLGDLPRMC